jgi:hypothetical protein
LDNESFAPAALAPSKKAGEYLLQSNMIGKKEKKLLEKAGSKRCQDFVRRNCATPKNNQITRSESFYSDSFWIPENLFNISLRQDRA